MDLLTTPLHAWHLKHGAKMVSFCGWDMPIRYGSLIEEHHAVRNHVGLFDVSHMGRILIEGKDAEAYLDYLSTAKISGKKDGSCAYTLFATSDGKGTVDDLLVYRVNKESFFLVVNGSRRKEDLEHLLKHKEGRDLKITERYSKDGIIAVQGPSSRKLLEKIFPSVSDMKFFRVMKDSYEGQDAWISRTGYTGELGFECIVPLELIEGLWSELMELGKEFHVMPIGLGARNTLRLEKGFALYGQELSESIAPHESIASWAVHFDKGQFLGKEIMEKNLSKRRVTVSLYVEGKEIPREGYAVLDNGKKIGFVTSGTRSPSFEKGIALALLDQSYEEGKELYIEVRKKQALAKVCSLPFS